MPELEGEPQSRAEQALRVFYWAGVGLLIALSVRDQMHLEGSRLRWHWQQWQRRREWNEAFRKACNLMLFEAISILDEAKK